jgi:transposase
MSNRKYTNEFKEEAIRLVKDHGYNQADAARRLGISPKNINRWMLEGVKRNDGKENPDSEQTEIHRLRLENERLRMEKEILKKAAAFFANEKY